MGYLLDANVFIQAKNLHYGLDFCPAFWQWLERGNAAGRVFSIERVGHELEAGGDELATWAADRGPGFFVKPDAIILPALSRVSLGPRARRTTLPPYTPSSRLRTTIWSRTRWPTVTWSSRTRSHRLRPGRSRSPTPASGWESGAQRLSRCCAESGRALCSNSRRDARGSRGGAPLAVGRRVRRMSVMNSICARIRGDGTRR